MNNWERNIWTGTDILRINKNGRIIRQSFCDGTFLYKAEHWGDHSFNYPIKGNWVNTLPQAKRELKEMQKKEEVYNK